MADGPGAASRYEQPAHSIAWEDAMKMDRDQLIRERAYAIWDREGRPNGRADAHWFQAVRELQAEGRLSGLCRATNRTSARNAVKPRTSLPPWGRRHWCHLAQRAA